MNNILRLTIFQTLTAPRARATRPKLQEGQVYCHRCNGFGASDQHRDRGGCLTCDGEGVLLRERFGVRNAVPQHLSANASVDCLNGMPLEWSEAKVKRLNRREEIERHGGQSVFEQQHSSYRTDFNSSGSGLTPRHALHAKDASESSALECRMPIGLPEGDVPSEVMVFPAGVHKIVASRAGEPVTATVSIGPEAARAMQASLQAHLAAGPQKPWFDFDHANGPASAWPIGFEWRDAPTPGVYAKVEWSKAGKEAIEGKMYRAFSPVFHVDKSTPAKVTGAPLNMGALVNAPAFREISPIWAQARQQKEGNNKMTEQELAALQARNTELESENKALKASANTAALEAKHNTAIAAKDSEITLLKNEVTTLKAAAQERAKNDAKAAVSAAVARGALPPKDEAIQAKWRSLIEADPSNAELLGKLQGNPALQASTTASLAAGATGSGATGGEAEQFVEAVKAKHAELKDRSKAVDAAIAACPAGYTAWRNANGKPGLVFA